MPRPPRFPNAVLHAALRCNGRDFHLTDCVRPAALLAAMVLAFAGAACSAEDEKPRDLKTRESKRKDGSVYRTETFYLGPDGGKVKHGPQVFWSDDGKKATEVHYRDGELHGMHTIWYPDGRKKSEGEWVNGEKQGVWTEWNTDGEKYRECRYVDGRIRGKDTYRVDGRKCREDTYDEDGKRVESAGWWRDGAKRWHGTYKGGLAHGQWTYWDAKGNVEADGEWRDGKPWEGTCAMPAQGELGSLAGVLKRGLYKQGKLVKEMGGF